MKIISFAIGNTILQSARHRAVLCYYRGIIIQIKRLLSHWGRGMDVTATLITAANIMVTGMVGVFLFLILLIFIVKYIASIAATEEPVKQQAKKASPAKLQTDGVPPEHVAAISAAVAQYKQQHQQG